MKTFSVVLAGFFIIWAYFSCVVNTPSSSPTTRSDSADVSTVVDKDAKDGLNLELLLPLVKEAENAEDLEKKINAEKGINNLDLNNDGKVDFIKVTEFGSKDAYGFSLTTFPEEGQEQEVATITIKKEGEEAQVQVAGNQQIYGQNHYYHSRFGVGEMLLMAYLLRPHPFYAPSFGWGYYPSYYRPWGVRPYSSYSSFSSTYRASHPRTTITRSYTPINTGLKSPNAGKTATSGIRRSLSNPTTAQKSFQTREASKAVKSGGFGRSSNTTRSGNVRSSSSRGFGGRGK